MIGSEMAATEYRSGVRVALQGSAARSRLRLHAKAPDGVMTEVTGWEGWEEVKCTAPHFLWRERRELSFKQLPALFPALIEMH